MYGAHSTGSAQAVGQDEIKPNTHGGFEIVWDEKLSARLSELWKNNSAGTIVKILRSEGHHFTRSAVMGRINRMKLHGKKERGDGRPRKPKNLERNAGVQVQAINRAKKIDGPPVKPELFKPRVADVSSCRKTIVEVGLATECQYPDSGQNAVGETTFCGHPVTAGSSYCAEHHAISHSKCIKITEADRARRKAHATKVWFGASVKLVGNPAEVA